MRRWRLAKNVSGNARDYTPRERADPDGAIDADIPVRRVLGRARCRAKGVVKLKFDTNQSDERHSGAR